jgi:hypothetical protein
MLDMLLRTENQVIDVFAGTPAAWPDVSVAGLRAPGFVDDASRSAGRTDWIRVHSGGEQTLLLRPGIAGDIEVRDERGGRLDWSLRGDGTVSVGLRDGGTAVITRRGSAPEPTIRDVAADATAEPWGMPG